MLPYRECAYRANQKHFCTQIVDAFGRVGLRFSLKKSEVMCTQQTLAVGKAFDQDSTESLNLNPKTLNPTPGTLKP